MATRFSAEANSVSSSETTESAVLACRNTATVHNLCMPHSINLLAVFMPVIQTTPEMRVAAQYTRNCYCDPIHLP